jgi:hypothetical protein
MDWDGCRIAVYVAYKSALLVIHDYLVQGLNHKRLGTEFFHSSEERKHTRNAIMKPTDGSDIRVYQKSAPQSIAGINLEIYLG